MCWLNIYSNLAIDIVICNLNMYTNKVAITNDPHNAWNETNIRD